MHQEMDFIGALSNNLSQIPKSRSTKARQVHFVIGSVGAGKTALMEHANLSLVQNVTDDNVEVNTWYDSDALFIEIPMALKNKPEVFPKAHKLLKKQCQQKQVHSFIVCINVFKAMQTSPKPFVKYLKRFARFINQIGLAGKSLPNLNLVFTQMDKVAGFSHSFSSDEKPWGYAFKPYINHASLLKQNSSLYEQLLKNLHNELINKLHNTEDKLTRYLIREFPLQMESIGNLVNACVNHLSNQQTKTHSVLFCSSLQSNSALDRLNNNIAQTYSLSIQSQIPQSSLDKPYFVSATIDFIKQSKQANSVTKSPVTKYGIIAASLVVLALGAHHYSSQQKIESAYQALASYYQSPKNNLDDLLPALEHLSNANQSIEKLHGIVRLNKIAALDKTVNKTFNDVLTNTLLPQIALKIEQQLHQAKQPADLFYALKAYKMLGDVKYLNQAFLTAYIEKLWQESGTKHQSKLKPLLIKLFGKPFQGMNLNTQLVQSSQNYLNALPSAYLYFKLIENRLPKNKTSISLNGFTPEKIDIPQVYQRKNFVEILQSYMPALINNIEKDNFVLESKPQNLLELLKLQYTKNYRTFWKKVALKVRPKTFQSYSEGNKLLNVLASNHSALVPLLELIQKNTQAFSNATNEQQQLFNKSIAAQFAESNLFKANELIKLKSLFASLAQFNQQLSVDKMPKHTAFNIAKARFEQNKKDPISQIIKMQQQLPYPANLWTKAVTSNSWYLILNDAQSYINEQWQNEIYPYYQSEILNHFPFSKQGQRDVSEQSFNQFFGPKGRLKQFLNVYLAPFLDTSHAKWQPKTQDELQLPIHHATIKEFIRSNVIREIFFQNGAEQPSVKFTLHLLAMDPIIAELQVNLNGQALTEDQSHKRSKAFIWPGDPTNQSTQIAVKQLSGKSLEFNEPGFWGWFRLMQKANIQPYDDDMTNFQLMFDINGNASKFLLVSESQLNPFIPGILENFTLPKNIT